MPAKRRRARLFSKVGETRGAEFEILGEATIGRNPDNAIVLEPGLVSSRHARISYDPEQESFVLEDLGSLNGTAVDGHAVRGREFLGHLHVITFAGKHDFIFQDVERCADRRRPRAAVEATPAPAAEPGPASPEVTGVEEVAAVMPSFLAADSEEGEPPHEVTSIDRAPAVMPSFLAGQEGADGATVIEKLPAAIPEALAGRDAAAGSQPPETLELDDVELPPASDLAAEQPPPRDLGATAGGASNPNYCLELAAADGGFHRVELVDGDNVLGRGADARIKPDSLDISRRHAVITVTEGRVTVRDLGSRNHTFVQDERIDEEVEIQVGARLRFGGVEARLIVADEG